MQEREGDCDVRQILERVEENECQSSEQFSLLHGYNELLQSSSPSLYKEIAVTIENCSDTSPIQEPLELDSPTKENFNPKGSCINYVMG